MKRPRPRKQKVGYLGWVAFPFGWRCFSCEFDLSPHLFSCAALDRWRAVQLCLQRNRRRGSASGGFAARNAGSMAFAAAFPCWLQFGVERSSLGLAPTSFFSSADDQATQPTLAR